MATTTNFGWETPDDTDLVKDGAAAIRTALGGVDTSFVDLKGGTTGQVLSKASNTDLDYTWVTTDDANAIQNAIVDAKGDLIAATAADTPARLAVGSNNQILMADSSASTGLKWAGDWQTWTPTYSGLTVGNGTVTAKYQQIGKLVNVYFQLTWGSTTSYSQYGTFTLPVVQVRGNYLNGTATMIDNGANIYPGQMWMEGTDRAYFVAMNTGATYGTFFAVQNVAPVTWGTSDVFVASFSYEAA